MGSNYQKREDGYIKIEEEKFKPAIKRALKYLKDKNYRKQAVEENFKIASENFSYQRLEELLKKLI